MRRPAFRENSDLHLLLSLQNPDADVVDVKAAVDECIPFSLGLGFGSPDFTLFSAPSTLITIFSLAFGGWFSGAMVDRVQADFDETVEVAA